MIGLRLPPLPPTRARLGLPTGALLGADRGGRRGRRRDLPRLPHAGRAAATNAKARLNAETTAAATTEIPCPLTTRSHTRSPGWAIPAR